MGGVDNHIFRQTKELPMQAVKQEACHLLFGLADTAQQIWPTHRPHEESITSKCHHGSIVISPVNQYPSSAAKCVAGRGQGKKGIIFRENQHFAVVNRVVTTFYTSSCANEYWHTHSAAQLFVSTDKVCVHVGF